MLVYDGRIFHGLLTLLDSGIDVSSIIATYTSYNEIVLPDINGRNNLCPPYLSVPTIIVTTNATVSTSMTCDNNLSSNSLGIITNGLIKNNDNPNITVPPSTGIPNVTVHPTTVETSKIQLSEINGCNHQVSNTIKSTNNMINPKQIFDEEQQQKLIIK